MPRPRFLLASLLLLIGTDLSASTISESVSLNVPTNSQFPSAQISVPVLIGDAITINDGQIEAVVSLAAFFGQNDLSACQPINNTQPWSCDGSYSGFVSLVAVPNIGINSFITQVMNFTIAQDGPHTGNFNGATVNCASTQSQDLTSCTMAIRPGTYTLQLLVSSSMSATMNSTITPFTDSVSASLDGDVTIIPEPALWPAGLLLIVGMLATRRRAVS